MKLVELLAKEMDKWPEGCTCGYCVQANESTEVFFGGPARSIFLSAMADDHEDARVTTEQWQAERDRQKGGEWKRHRGGKMPVADDVRVEVKLRDGDIHQSFARCFAWPHSACDVYANIMQYRIISQPQAEEVEVKDTTIGTLSYKISVDQIAGPLAWRDTIIHCQAIIEDCEREIAKNENMLALEGFALIPAMTPAVGVADIDMSDWRNWKAGDELECVFSEVRNIYTVGESYTVKGVEDDYAIVTDDTCGGEGTCHISSEDTSDIRFIRRP